MTCSSKQNLVGGPEPFTRHRKRQRWGRKTRRRRWNLLFHLVNICASGEQTCNNSANFFLLLTIVTICNILYLSKGMQSLLLLNILQRSKPIWLGNILWRCPKTSYIWISDRFLVGLSQPPAHPLIMAQCPHAAAPHQRTHMHIAEVEKFYQIWQQYSLQ